MVIITQIATIQKKQNKLEKLYKEQKTKANDKYNITELDEIKDLSAK